MSQSRWFIADPLKPEIVRSDNLIVKPLVIEGSISYAGIRNQRGDMSPDPKLRRAAALHESARN